MAGGAKNGGGPSLYAVLGVASDCSDAELRSAYRKLAMVRAVLDPSLCFLCSLLAPCVLGLLCFAGLLGSAQLCSARCLLTPVPRFLGRDGTPTSAPARGAPPAARTRPRRGSRRSREPTPVKPRIGYFNSSNFQRTTGKVT